LLQVLGPVEELTTHFYLVAHRDLRDAPRVRAFSSFVDDNLKAFRAVLGGAGAGTAAAGNAKAEP